MNTSFSCCAVMALLLNVASVTAEPFLSADPQPEATAYRIRLSIDDGATWGAWTQGPPGPAAHALRPATGRPERLHGRGAGSGDIHRHRQHHRRYLVGNRLERARPFSLDRSAWGDGASGDSGGATGSHHSGGRKLKPCFIGALE